VTPATRVRWPALLLVAEIACGCGASVKPGPARRDANPAPPLLEITERDTRFVTEDVFLAALEMQLSGEPLAQAMGRNLAGYERSLLPTDQYSPDGSLDTVTDVAGFSIAVESYEYSKQPMNNVALESGAGTSLMFAPLVNPTGSRGAKAVALLEQRIEKYALATHAWGRFAVAPGTWRGASPNPLAYPGLWPTAHVFASFDPSIAPTSSVSLDCAIPSDEGSGDDTVGDYECDPTTLHLPDREKQVEFRVTTGADGFSAWKYALWIINYLQVMHDTSGNLVSSVPEAELPLVGTPDNSVTGVDASGKATFPGTYAGSSDLEGFQAALFIDEVDNRAADWLLHFTTTDGSTLSGFSSLSDALSYREDSPLRWFPESIRVTEGADSSGFPIPSYALDGAGSELLGLLSLAGAYAELYALTDRANPDVGGSQAVRVYFDGDPFGEDDGQADGEPTLHDRALAMIRVAVLDADRLHRDPTSGALADAVAFAGATPTRGSSASIESTAYALVALRTVERALGSELTLYSNNSPDTALLTSPLDSVPVNAAGVTFSERLHDLIRSEAALLYDSLTTPDGRAFDALDLATGKVSGDANSLDAHTAAIRGLFTAYLATGDTRYRDRAEAVFNRLETVFYDPSARIYTATPSPAPFVDFGPVRFGMLQAALRETYLQLGDRPGHETLGEDLEGRIGRLNKLVLNGWNDRNDDSRVQWPSECVQVTDGMPSGGLEMAERALTGEIGSVQTDVAPGDPRTPTSDRDRDCVPEIDDAHLPAALAHRVRFTIYSLQ
jgi:hypothetical protein